MRKAVIPAAGLGTRFLPATKAQPKEMLPVVDKPAIQYVVEEAVRAGLDDILIITGRSKRSLEDHFDRSPELEAELTERGNLGALDQVRLIAELADIHYVRQGEPLGLGHAIGTARKHVGDQPFVVLLGDDIIHERVHLLEAMIAAHQRVERSVVALLEVPDPSAYGCAQVEATDDDELVRIAAIVEKPRREDAPSNLAVMGRYVLTPSIFDAIDRVKPGKGGEIQITDALALLVEEEGVFGFPFAEGRYDTGNKLDYLKATVELAAERADLGPAFRAFLAELVAREGFQA
ncbi:MAG: UTP--glucose-1-phosphate uridylyltransferase GalU [Acidimicrobiales bacterium]